MIIVGRGVAVTLLEDFVKVSWGKRDKKKKYIYIYKNKPILKKKKKHTGSLVLKK